ncbi:vascular-related unknown protein 1-like [Rhodamnia argentea]|uniref:Uncharacterized protein n=1 Tax=Rhodamnia argentea TaxID=178133 RepID=A0A8B8QGZ5_9MYRT|nr:vascular-related unknown protein 1-like [Rhodamnia argentea]
MEEEDSRSMKKPIPDGEGSEESGWTTYLEDFSRNSADGGDNSFCSTFRTLPMVSDAASCAIHGNAVAEPNPPRRLSTIKRTRTREITDEDPLEDTATSPVNSPKINHLKRMEMMGTRMTDDPPLHHALGNGGASESCMGLKVRESSESEKTMCGGDDWQKYECSSLRKRGLCLVPLSIFMNNRLG